MDETTGQIRDDIDTQREELGQHLHQVEDQARQAMDWRARFDERPMAMIGMAFGGGLLLSALMGGGGGSSQNQQQHESSSGGSSGRSLSSSPEGREMSETVDNIRGALMGLAAREMRSFLSTALPGFEEEYRESTNRRQTSSDARLNESSRESGNNEVH